MKGLLDSVTVTNSTDDFQFGQGDFTIDFWVKHAPLKPVFKSELDEALHNL